MAICPHCNVQNPDGSPFCYSCGNPMAGNSENPLPPSGVITSKTRTINQWELPVGARVTGTVAMVCGIVSCISCCLGIIPGIAAFVLSFISQEKNIYGLDNRPVTVARITGGIGLVLSFICIFAYLALLSG